MAKISRPIRKIGPWWRSQLQGIFCIYKPPEYSYSELCKALREILLKDLNQKPCYPGERYHKDAYLLQTSLKNLPSQRVSTKKTPPQLLQYKSLEENTGSFKLSLSVIDSKTGEETMDLSESGIKNNGDDSSNSDAYLEERVEKSDLALSSNTNVVSIDFNMDGNNHLFSSKLKDLIIPPLTERNVLKHRFVCGDMFRNSDVKVLPVYDGLDYECTGVVPVCVGYRNSDSYALRDNLEKKLFIRVYHLSGTLGWTTLDNTAGANKIKRHSYEHVGKSDMDKICGLAQNMHQWRMLNYAGVIPNSQEAYDLLKQGLVKPMNSLTPPLIYGVKCIKFEPPHFTLEVHCVNESYTFLRDFVYKVGVAVRSSAFCSKIRRIRYGPIGLEYALVVEDWGVEKICNSIRQCNKLLTRKDEKQSDKETKELESAVD
ncbi:pseudouridylate synthase TRUB2, mitochondrial-like [Saccostrea echinata]|uniref:pseudouridylate synthase TRUB2, mitochondrial-like n=1 Tax=Saccostrea echinata TaxID=191078 RepID=UPI002A83933F|nr:pseudouridylate synthase TRUB2, mitochondrial-like [Saccostrea echinata]